MPYTSAGHEGTTPRRSLFKSQEESLIISNIFYAVVKYDSYGHYRPELNHISGCFSQICQDISQMNMKSFQFCTTEKEGALVIGHGRLYMALYGILIYD